MGPSALSASAEVLEHVAELVFGKDWTAERLFQIYLVGAPSTLSLPRQVALFVQLGDDPLGASFRDAQAFREVTNAKGGVLQQQDQGLGVICENGPAAHVLLG